VTQLRTHPDTGELVRSAGSFDRIGGADEIAQHVRTRMRLFRGEVPTNLALGMRYVGVVLGKGVPPERVEGEFVEMALGTPGVVQVDRMDLQTDDARHAVVDFEGTIDLGDARRRIPLHDTFTIGI
jgi:hypothetical protein